MSTSANSIPDYTPYVFIGLLCITTVLFFNLTPHYLPGKQDLLSAYNADNHLYLTTSKQGSSLSGDRNNSTWHLENKQVTDSSWIDLDIVPTDQHEALYLSAEIKTRLDPVTGNMHRTSANLMLLSADRQQRWDYLVPHLLADISTTQDWLAYSAGFSVKPDASRYRISANLAGVSGEMQVRNISLYSAAKNPVYTTGYYTLLLTWVWLLLYLTRHKIISLTTIRQYWPLAAVLLLILIGILLPVEVKNSLLLQVYQTLTIIGINLPSLSASPESGIDAVYRIDKLGHLIAFGMAGFILYRRKTDASGNHLLLLVSFAAITETLQYFVPGRNPLLSDLLIDIVGIAAGISLARVFRWIVV